jgi:hypothetical protein
MTPGANLPRPKLEKSRYSSSSYSCNSKVHFDYFNTQSSCFVLRFILPPWREHTWHTLLLFCSQPVRFTRPATVARWYWTRLNNVLPNTSPPTSFTIPIRTSRRPNHNDVLVLGTSTPSQTDDPAYPLALVDVSKAVQLCPHVSRSCVLLPPIVGAGRRPFFEHGHGHAGDWACSSILLRGLSA